MAISSFSLNKADKYNTGHYWTCWTTIYHWHSVYIISLSFKLNDFIAYFETMIRVLVMFTCLLRHPHNKAPAPRPPPPLSFFQTVLLLFQMQANFPEVDFLGTTLKFRKRKKNPSSLVYVLNKTWNLAFSSCSRAGTAKKCTTLKAWGTCKIVVLLDKPFAFLTFS